MKVRNVLKIAASLLLLVLLSFCRKATVASWDVDLVLPIVNSQLNIKNFLGDSVFKPDNTGLLSLQYTRTLTAVKLDSLIKLPDTTIVNSFTVPAVFPTTLTPGQALTFFPPTELEFNISNGVALKKVDVRSGVLRIKFSNDLSEPLDLLYKITSATKNGQPLIISEKVPPAPDSLVKYYNLSGYNLNMRGLNGNVYNTIVQSYTVIVDPSANPVVVTYGQGAHAKLTYSKIIPQYLEGYFGQQTIVIPTDTAKLDILKNVKASNFLLNSATLNFRILNEFGAEFTGSLSNIKSVNAANASTVNLITSQLSNININRATKVGSSVYQSVKTISLTNTNSNIVPFLSNLPNKLSYQGSVNVNPLGNLSGYNDFAFYNTGIKVVADINIPLRFNADYFKLTSNANIDFSNLKQLDHVNYGQFIINTSNGYPFQAKLQAYLIDDYGVVVDSLFTPGQNIIDRGLVDLQNVVTQSTRSQLKIPLDQFKISNLKKSKKLRIETYFIMPPNPPDIKIYEDYSLDVNIIAEINYRLERK
ncbi:MAG: hypothetical protein JWO32_2237 [Bacteroidetes bacterium]|nr:hypothetical protein [Bacteroidota bacterium]